MSSLALGTNQIELERGLPTSSTAIFVPVSYTHLELCRNRPADIFPVASLIPVSYTHLDVYKRQSYLHAAAD